MLKNFKIDKLFGFRNVDIKFDSNIKILIGENGLGKTTILNSLYYVLNKLYTKLLKVDFENIELTFKDNKKISFSKQELEAYIEYQNNRLRQGRVPISIRKIIDNINYKKFKESFKKSQHRLLVSEREKFNKFIITNDIPRFASLDIMYREINRFIEEPKFENFVEINKVLDECNFSILYLPTYRRVEEDLKNLGKFRKKNHNIFEDDTVYYEEVEDDIEITDNTLIHFGMEDVEYRIKTITSEINKSTINGFSKVTGEMLSQLLKGFPNIEDKDIDSLDESTVKIIIHRVGDNISDTDRVNILNLIENRNELKNKRELVYFIYKLIDIYEQHKHLDNAVKSFCNICNKYLTDKHFIYNESAVEVDIFRKNTEDRVLLNKLSSGEKQIISIFSKLYLENIDKNINLIVLFDEPELSLSLPWQTRLLPDMVNSNKCAFLLSVTHSPFIFDNELDKYAIGMDTYISE